MKLKIQLIIRLFLAGVSTVLLNELLISNGVLAQNASSSSPQESPTMRSSNNFNKRPLTAASTEEVGQVAIDYTRTRFNILSKEPQVVIARPVTTDDLSDLGLPTDDYDPQDFPQMLVVLKGDFDVSNLFIGGKNSPNTWHKRVNYIAYIFDLRAGAPMLTQTSAKGGILRKLLNDPTLPNDPIANPQGLDELRRRKLPEAVPVPEGRRAPKLPYGSVAPPVPRIPITDLPPFAPSDQPVEP